MAYTRAVSNYLIEVEIVMVNFVHVRLSAELLKSFLWIEKSYSYVTPLQMHIDPPTIINSNDDKNKCSCLVMPVIPGKLIKFNKDQIIDYMITTTRE